MAKIENPIRTTISIIFGVIFPLFGIFIYTQFDYMGVKLYDDIFLGFQTDINYALFQWFYSLFKSDMINQIGIHGIGVIISQPMMSALFMWFLDGFFINVFLKEFKKGLLISILTAISHLLLLILFAAICDGSYNTLDLLFGSNLLVFSGSILTMIILVPFGACLGYIAGRE